MKRWKKRVLAILLGVVLALGLAEGVARVAGLGGVTLTRGALHRYDADAGWVCVPNLDAHYVQPGSFDVRIRCNSRGLRGGEHAFEKPAGTRRIVMLGDSFMWGYGVENDEMLSSVVAGLLPRTETINLGANGYSTVQEVVRLETEGLRYHPDVVVLAFTWNDLEDNFDDKHGGRPVAAIGADGALQIRNRPVRRQWKNPVKQWFRHHSHLFRLLEYSTETFKWKMKQRRRARRAREAAKPGLPGREAQRARPGDMEFTLLDVYGAPPPEIDRAWLAVELLVRRARDLARGSGARLLLVNDATQEILRKDRFEALMRRYARDLSGLGLDWDRPAKRLRGIGERLGVAFVDMTPAFRRAADPDTLYLKNNGHWSAAGHKLAGEVVAGAVRALPKP